MLPCFQQLRHAYGLAQIVTNCVDASSSMVADAHALYANTVHLLHFAVDCVTHFMLLRPASLQLV
jgi:hypothetical protein